ncbi:membrane-spanning 4-domains subfamily A member 15 [Astyanax mexicanus]|uniref:membrane-spanning 4-domains subfamily A member 15 n=1 Tax=Astyanax mexicanus TaxID=7994 RepID=UPI000BBDD50B|nr:membrane-spanning 4-domains subfamily A member 15 [Astyanax mexicanus]XP_022529306.1 membrane-spanning 4-domains subfamily A member 15 [Astyanax mexicanus]
MATSVSTAAHGVRVVTHIIPLETPEPPCPTQSKDSKQSENKPSKPSMTSTFLRGVPVALGTVQIFVGLVMAALGTITWVSGVLRGEVPLGLGISFFICGSVSLAANKGTSPGLIKSALALNIIGAMLASAGVCYFAYVLAIPPNLDGCGQSQYYNCTNIAWTLTSLILGVKITLLVLCVLELCVCTSLAVFSAMAIHQASVTKTVDGVQTAVAVCYSGHEPLLNGGGEDVNTFGQPPAYQP